MIKCLNSVKHLNTRNEYQAYIVGRNECLSICMNQYAFWYDHDHIIYYDGDIYLKVFV